MCFRILALLLICQIPFFAITAASASRQEASVSLKLTDMDIIQGEELPQFHASVDVLGNTSAVLDKKTDYTVNDFLEELKRGEGYTIVCDADAAVEGEYSMSIQLDDDIKKALKKEWVGLVRIDLYDAVFAVKNAVGEWDGNKFRRYDGTYIKNDFVVSKGNTYYLGENTAGWQDINGARYYMDKEGAIKTGWMEQDDSKYYMGQEGKMATGWQDIGEDTYYFDQEGKMATGETYLGLTKCTFSKDGVLKSMEESEVDPNKPMVALTFDDGPGERTGELLEVFEKYHAHATFFMLGQNVPSYKDEIKRMKEAGCELGSHSYDHANLSKLEEKDIKDQMKRTNKKLNDIVGQEASVMRPPYGAISDTMKSTIKMPMILWNIDTLDWKTRNAQKTVDLVMQKVGDGDVILLHDIHSESVDAAMELVPKLIAEGYQLVTVSEMAAAKDIKMKDGESYTDFTNK